MLARGMGEWVGSWDGIVNSEPVMLFAKHVLLGPGVTAE